eukprot:758772-Hanusia_phi.AAC.1
MADEWQGISLTALKRACKRVGVASWPYSRQRAHGARMPCEEDKEKKDQRVDRAQACSEQEALFEEALRHVENKKATGH